ncbi:potassium channel family protein [Chitinispirillales bacterium ANBcel5]|uniref:potassium channel family protein n=1 Tax=Cellulosispirillum alkaliphilum TaxID=3039283 RepID=UPI002A4E39D8|nr:potassium channel family protein [Chitinispirillales bacterium ANBcel5]
MKLNRNDSKWPSGLKFTASFVRIFLRFLGLTFPAWGAILIAVVLLGLLFSAIEQHSMFDSLYFMFITSMTIGYGDITPVTPSGKILSVVGGILGILTTGIVVAVALQALKTSLGLKQSD